MRKSLSLFAFSGLLALSGWLAGCAATSVSTDPQTCPDDLSPEAEPRVGNAASGAVDRSQSPRLVRLETADGMILEADVWRDGSEVAGVVLLHMYQTDRLDWRPLVGSLREKNLAIIAVDMRGHGGSRIQQGVDLHRKVTQPDSGLFFEAYHDADAAIGWLNQEGIPSERVVLVGASIGSSVAFEAAARTPDIPAVVALSPGEAYQGLPTMKAVETFVSQHALLISSEAEADNGTRKIAAQMGEKAEIDIIPGGRAFHGTHMFGFVEGIEDRVAAWIANRLG